MKRALALLILALPLFAETPPRNWGRCPAVVTLETTERVFALGDTHGDYDRLVTLLAAGKLIEGVPDSPENVKWSGGRSILVVTGDMIDKGKQSLKVIAAMRALTSSAASQGGRVIISTGNHEAEFLADPHGSKTTEFQKELKAAGIKRNEVADGTDKDGIGKFLLCLPFASRVNSWFFSHAGSTDGRTLTKLIADLQKGIDEDGYNTKVLLGKKGLLEARMKPPWWERSGEDPSRSMARLLGYADALGAKQIVFGHQPGTYIFNNDKTREKGTMFQNYSGLVFLIDMGMSSGVNYSHGALLRIESGSTGDTATAVYPDGSEKPIWPLP
ncbi:MAG TPA: metallophosphoesterase [Thermoanaerobaculia bacterium]|nr:metallophosphoesterase [Thermoanaerobaculia bacterium]